MKRLSTARSEPIAHDFFGYGPLTGFSVSDAGARGSAPMHAQDVVLTFDEAPIYWAPSSHLRVSAGSSPKSKIDSNFRNHDATRTSRNRVGFGSGKRRAGQGISRGNDVDRWLERVPTATPLFERTSKRLTGISATFSWIRSARRRRRMTPHFGPVRRSEFSLVSVQCGIALRRDRRFEATAVRLGGGVGSLSEPVAVH